MTEKKHSEARPTGKTNDGGERRRRRTKVLLVDDHTMFREGLAGMLTSSSYGDEVEVVGKTGLGEEAVKVVLEEDPDVIIMQVDRTLKKAKDALMRMREGSSSSPPKVIILTVFEDAPILREMMGLGASAYIHKSASVEQLFAAVRNATLDTRGEHMIVVLPQGKLELSEDGYGKAGSGRGPTKRELEILLLAARGMGNAQIASHLDIGEGTVKRHLANLYPKMGVGSRGEALRVALENEWFTIGEIEAAIVEDE
jgi:DNA-binding NarL/FixJ family response regulator